MKFKDLTIGDYIVFDYDNIKNISGKILNIDDNHKFIVFDLIIHRKIGYEFYQFSKMSNIRIIDETEYLLRK